MCVCIRSAGLGGDERIRVQIRICGRPGMFATAIDSRPQAGSCLRPQMRDAPATDASDARERAGLSPLLGRMSPLLGAEAEQGAGVSAGAADEALCATPRNCWRMTRMTSPVGLKETVGTA